jgi:hypothetical protein
MKSNSTDAQYVTLQVEENTTHTGLAQCNGFHPSIFAPFAEADNRHSKAYLFLMG